MKYLLSAAAALALFSASLFGQASNASVNGFVQDATGAFVPGVSVKATNTQTGIVTAVITNEAGTYNIPSLLPGTYRLTAELPGFRTAVINDVQLGASAAGRYNFTMEVGEVTQAVEVTANNWSGTDRGKGPRASACDEQCSRPDEDDARRPRRNLLFADDICGHQRKRGEHDT
jgi:hypothetical protein